MDNNEKTTALFIRMPFRLFSAHILNWYGVNNWLLLRHIYGILLMIMIYLQEKSFIF